MRSRLFAKLLVAALLIIVIATAVLDVAIRRAWEASLLQQITTALEQKTRLAAQQVSSVSPDDLPSLANTMGAAAGARVTIIDTAGHVLADSEANRETMENHATRPEFRAALRGMMGSDTRRSHTLGIDFLYVATPIPGGAVRLAYPLADIQKLTSHIRRTLLLSSALALLVAAILAAVAAQLISRRFKRIIAFAEEIARGNLTARLSSSSGDEIGQVASALDSTARQLERSFAQLEHSHAELEVVLNSMEDAVLSVSRDGRLLWVNKALERLLAGRLRIEQPLTETLRDPDLLAAINIGLKGAVTHAHVRSAVPGRTLEVTAAPMPGGAAVCVLHDITEIERVEKTRRDFIANVSHELRTPLTSILGYTETLLDSAAISNGEREFLGIMRRNAQHMARLTEDLLTLARVESGEHKLAFENVPAGELIARAIQTLQPTARERGVELTGSATSDLTVHADPDAVQQVFNNLIENATRYAASGRRIEIGVGARDGGAEFYVRDFGPGIASEHLPRLFERFYRVDKARSRETGGTGLGLAIVKHIVMNHGGTVRVESSLGHGSTFYFTLPLVRSAVMQ